MRPLLPALAVLALAACSQPAPQAKAPEKAAPTAAKEEPITAPAGDYVMDKDHTSVNFRISHLGFSKYTARFTGIDGKLHFDPANPTSQTVEATIDANSLQTNYTHPEKLDFDRQIEKEMLNADKHPQITFKSTKVELTGPRAAKVTGDFTMNGVTKPVVLDATFNGGYPPNQMDPGGARIGFSAHTILKRSEFGLTAGIPAPGSNMGVGDDIDVAIEAEFQKK
jgi:polyisoprenoid-binding protein YceI